MFECKGFSKLVEEDSYEHGCVANTAQEWFVDYPIAANTLRGVKQVVIDLLGCSDDAIDVNACDEPGRIDVQTFEDEEGNEPTPRQREAWERDELNLYACTYTFHFEQVTRSPAFFNEEK